MLEFNPSAFEIPNFIFEELDEDTIRADFESSSKIIDFFSPTTKKNKYASKIMTGRFQE